jgi:AraC-like DNA-binding protein
MNTTTTTSSERPTEHPSTPVERVRALLCVQGGFRSLTEIAEMLSTSTRSLKRHLAQHGTTFSTLLSDARRETALTLLKTSDMTLDEIAGKAGYSNLSNFVRAFRRWEGTTPTAFRRMASPTDTSIVETSHQ